VPARPARAALWAALIGDDADDLPLGSVYSFSVRWRPIEHELGIRAAAGVAGLSGL